MEFSRILMVGGSRGIGARLLEMYSASHEVIATTRDREKADGISRLYLDLSKLDSLKDFTCSLGHQKFDLILFVAAFTIPEQADQQYVKKFRFGSLDYESFEEMLKVNCFAQVKLFEMLYDNGNVTINARVCFFSSRAGAISTRGKLAHHRTGGDLTYRVSKGALNVAVKNLAYDFCDGEMVIIALHPGWVKTDAGGESADIETNDAAVSIGKLLTDLDREDSGNFLDLTGKVLEW
jgi:NAD(P)-dependent dehydrogenase (short-subunit alcohol dehydrogenase family)